MYQYIYGPVPSRRLGISLGVDLIPYKICSFNCVYCECGRNTSLTSERKEYQPVELVLSEIRDYMAKNPAPDFISLSGSGEPTLHSQIGYLIDTVKNEYPDVKVAVLTNGSLLFQEQVQLDLMNADLILPSLDAATKEAYLKIDRPESTLSLDTIIQGIADFTSRFKSQAGTLKEVWLEVFLIEGINTDAENIDSLRDACVLIRPDRIQLNTLDRPGTEAWVKPVTMETLERVSLQLNLPHVEIITSFKNRDEIKHYRMDVENLILESVARRPMTLDDICGVVGLRVHEVSKYLDVLEKDKLIQREVYTGENGRGVFYKLKTQSKT